MKEFNFTIQIINGFNKGAFAFIDVRATEWDNPVEEESYTGLTAPIIQSYLATAYCMYGQIFNMQQHTPRELYKALCGNTEYEVTVDGEIPEDDEDDDIPPDACY